MSTETHEIPGARFMDPKVLARIGNLELVSHAVVDGFINGLHKAPYFGASVDFAEHRGYVPGDDIRRVDWKLWARTDRYYVKEYEADSNSNFSVLLDVSKSLGFGTHGLTKLEYGKMLDLEAGAGRAGVDPRVEVAERAEECPRLDSRCDTRHRQEKHDRSV